MAFADELSSRIAGSESKARGNYHVAYFFIIIGVVASSAATISVAASVLSPVINATFATLPGIVVMVLNTFKFEARSKWWWQKNFYLLELQAELKMDGSNESEIKKKMAKFLLEHSKDWPGFEFDRPPTGIPHNNAVHQTR